MDEEQKIVSDSALPDTRPQTLRDKDYSTEEVAAALAVTPFQNPKPTALGATLFNQWYVGSCVPHGFYTALEYEGIVAPPGMSQLRVYRKRSNYPQPGSNGVDIFDKIRAGQSNDFPTPQGFTEAQATAMPYVLGSKILKDFRYYQYVDKKTGALLLQDVPPDVAVGKAVPIFIFATEEEWSKEYVEVINPALTVGEAYVRHCVCIMPKGDFMENGKRWLAVHDSAAFGGRHLRYVEYDSFFLKRAYFAAKVLPVEAPQPPEPQPIQKPLTECQLGDKGDAVKNLQAFLIADGKLEKQYLTGNYGALTARAVLWWQLEHWDKFTSNIPKILEWDGKYWGKQSIAIISA